MVGNRLDLAITQCLSNFRQLRTITWAVGAREDHSAIITFPLAVKSTQSNFSTANTKNVLVKDAINHVPSPKFTKYFFK